MSDARGRVAIVFPGDTGVGQAAAPSPRLVPVISALEGLGVDVEPVGYSAARADEVRNRLLACDGVLTWVDPIGPDGERTVLDALLREAAEAGAWIGSHPDVIAQMGTKEVLYTTRGLGGPKTADGHDSYQLCEINASSVTPFPPEAVPLLAQATAHAVAAARAGRLQSLAAGAAEDQVVILPGLTRLPVGPGLPR